jgi:hypothetical protein
MTVLTLTDSLIGKVTGGAITGLDGGIWSATPGFYPNPTEFAKIVTAFKPNSDAPYKGITFQGEPYILTMITEDALVAQRSNHAVIIAKCPRCLVFGFHDEQMPYAKCFQAVSELAARLRTPEMESLL